MLYTSDLSYQGLARTMETRCLPTVLFHRRRRTLRSMQNLNFQMLQLMKQTMMDLTRKVSNFCMLFIFYSTLSVHYNVKKFLFVFRALPDLILLCPFASCCYVASKTPSWTHVRSNLFLHRNRRTQSIDEVCTKHLEPLYKIYRVFPAPLATWIPIENSKNTLTLLPFVLNKIRPWYATVSFLKIAEWVVEMAA